MSQNEHTEDDLIEAIKYRRQGIDHVCWLDDDGKFHRVGRPAIIYNDGAKFWIRHGDLHREDGPAVENADGSEYWYLNGKMHREDGPAVIYPNGDLRWYKHGRLQKSFDAAPGL